jgi:solute carrier family 27 fatty acid transporter 1/4
LHYNLQAAQYIGEICRYLLSAPESPEEKKHNVQLMFGNGLRPQIWDLFVRRFNIKRIGEFYGATEGNSSVVNIDGRHGAVGFTSVLFPFVYPVRLIKVNEATGQVARDGNGLCVLCKPGEPGEFIGKIVKNHPSRGFDGYVDKKATEKKIVHDVMSKGDMWFRSGDLLTMDELGWMYFVDRMGDTFRWRGENVSTNEVEAVLSNVLQQQDTIVYGVEVPGVEGRAGMAAIVAPSGGLDLNSFLAAVKKQLPSYATPIFLRLVQHLDLTGTFKLKKIALQQEGYNPNVVRDQMFFLDAVKGAYRQLDNCLYNDIIEMRCRL